MFFRGGLKRMLGAAACLLVPGVAMAQTFEEPEPASPATYTEPAPEVRRGAPASGYGIEVALGGGVTNFTEDAARALTDVGGAWNLRLSFGTRSFAGFEAAYVGSAQGVAAPGLDPDAYLVSNGVEGALRLNVPLSYRDWMFSPFALVGIGWTRYDIVNEAFNTSPVANDDDVVMLPLGAGIAASYRGFMFDTRFTYRAAYDDDLLGNANMHNWILSANLGREF